MARQLTGAFTFPAGVAVGTGVGGAVATALQPRLQALLNEAWEQYQSMPLVARDAAQLVANGERDMAWGVAEAKQVGVSEARFAALVDMWDTSLDQSLLMDAWRRGLIGEAAFRRGAKRHGIEDEWIDVLVKMRERILSPDEAANAYVQGYMSETEASAEAALSGVSPERSQIQRQITGLPPGPMDGLTLWRRGLITEAEYEQLVREGHTKTKYVDPLKGLYNRILSGAEWAGLWLRGWVTEAQAKAGGALDGWDAEAMDLLYKNRGRPATVRQVHIGYARGAKLPGAADEEAALETAVRQSNIRTEYTALLKAQRYTYPSAFVIRALAAAGTFDNQTTRQILIESGWRPDYAKLAADAWTGGGETAADQKWANRARSSAFSAAWSDYLDGNAEDDDFRAVLETLGAATTEQDIVLQMANVTRTRTRRDLTQAQILKLYKKSIWTREQAQMALEDLGMEAGDAGALLDAV